MNKNTRTLITLNNTLFAQLERLDEDMSAEQLKIEINRTKAMGLISQSIINNARLQLKAIDYRNEKQLNEGEEMPAVLALDSI